MSLLIIALPLDVAANATLFDFVLSPDGSTPASQGSVPLALLPAHPERQTEVVALVPAQALSWHLVQLPQGSLPRRLTGDRGAARLQAILQGLLEDQLLDEPAQLHLALQPRPVANAAVWVAACDRAWLQAALAALSATGHAVTRIVPEFTPQGLEASIFVTGDEAEHAQVAGLRLAASGAACVLACDLSASSVALLGSRGQEVLAEPAVAAQAEQLFGRPVTLLLHGQRLLQAALSPWDLAQFDFAHAGRDRRWSRLAQSFGRFAKAPQWRATRLALVAVLLVNLVGLNLWAWREQASLQARRLQVNAVLLETFPKTQVVVDAPVQMARELAALQRASGSPGAAGLERILSSFSAVAPADYAVTAIDYVANELRLSGPPLAPEAQAQVIAGLRAMGLAASVQGDQWLIVPGAAP